MQLHPRIKVVLTSHLLPILFLLCLGGFTHATNMFSYPYYEGDEGTYTSQAWSVVREGELSPYTYWYDHPPMGWLVIAGWFKALGDDVFFFGTSIDTARVLMLIVYLITLCTIYWLSYKVSESKIAALVVSTAFALSPLGIYFRRRVLLDNLMTMWLLLSFVPLMLQHPKLRHFASSGVLYGIAFLTKITAAVWGPAILFLVVMGKYVADRVFRITTWLLFSIGTVALYLMYALMKSEFFPAGWFDDSEHVSLLSSLFFQMGRGNSLPFYHPNSDAYGVVVDWLNKDSLAVILLIVSFVGGLILTRWRPLTRPFVIASILYLVFLVRGGIVFNFYILPLMATLTILGAAVLNEGAALVRTGLHAVLSLVFGRSRAKQGERLSVAQYMKDGLANGIPFVLLIILGTTCMWHYLVVKPPLYLYVDEVSPQREAIAWIKTNLPEEAAIVIDNTMLVELRDGAYLNEKEFVNADWFYKVSNDPSIRTEKYYDNWKSFEYIVLTHEILKQIERFEKGNIVRSTFENSLPIQKWIHTSSSFIDEQKLITTNGDWAMVFAVNGNTKTQLVDSWKTYRETFVQSYGQVVDPQTKITTSEGQSYAMLRAAWMNDREAFDGVWLWTQHHLQHRLDDKLLSWKWGNDRMLDPTNAADADIDTALALIFAYKVWQDETYLNHASEIIDDIWKKEVVEIRGTLYLIAMDAKSAERHGGYLMNPSYLSPAHFRIFAEVDPIHDWEKLANDSYRVLKQTQRMSANGLPANWYIINDETGALSSAAHVLGRRGDYYGYDAFRTLWRVGLDAEWYETPDAKTYLVAVHNTLLQYDAGYGLPSEIDTVSGNRMSSFPSLATRTGYLVASKHAANIPAASAFYQTAFEQHYDNETHVWGNSANYYDQNWAWFGIGLFNGDLPNLWNTL